MQFYRVLSIIFVLTATLHAEQNVEEASFNSATGSSASVQVPSTMGYSKQDDNCVCTYYQLGRYLRAEVNGRDMIYGISLRKGRTAVLSCRNSSMNLVWPNGAFMSKSANLTCIECREWKVGDIPSCQASLPASNLSTAQTSFPVDDPDPEDECSCEYTWDDQHIIAHSNGKLVKLHDRVKSGSILTFRCAKIGYYRFVGVKELQCENCQFQNISEPPSCTRPERGDAMIFLDKNVNVSLEGVLQVQKLKPLRLVCSVMETAEFPIWNVPNVAGINLTEEIVENSKDDHHFLSHLEIDKVMPGDSGSYTCALDKDEGRPAVVQVEVIDEVPFNPTTESSVLYNNETSSPRIVEDLPFRQLDNCTCTSFHPDSNRLVNGVKSQYTIRVQKGQIAMLSCIDPRMDLIWKNSAMTTKSINLKCNTCRKYESEEIPICQDSRQEIS